MSLQITTLYDKHIFAQRLQYLRTAPLWIHCNGLSTQYCNKNGLLLAPWYVSLSKLCLAGHSCTLQERWEHYKNLTILPSIAGFSPHYFLWPYGIPRSFTVSSASVALEAHLTRLSVAASIRRRLQHSQSNLNGLHD